MTDQEQTDTGSATPNADPTPTEAPAVTETPAVPATPEATAAAETTEATDAVPEAGVEAPPAPAPAPVPPRPARRDGPIWGTGRRKSSVSRVRLAPGTGNITVNGKEYKDFFPTELAQLEVTGPLRVTETLGKFDLFVNVNGGGITGQAGATALGIGRALKEIEPSLEATLREAGFLTRDSRMKERKKYGLRGARRAFQFSKR